MPLPLPGHRGERHPKPAGASFTDADVVLAQLEDATRQYGRVLDRLIQVLKPNREGR